MPELPEVETTLRGIEPHILNRKIKRIVVRQPSLRWPVPNKELQKKLKEKSFSKIQRRAKYLILESYLGNLIIHLGMSGSLKFFPEKKIPGKHDHIDINFEGNRFLRFTDPRRFGSFHWVDKDRIHPLLSNLGPEPLGNSFSGTYLFKNSRGKKIAIKNFLMNSKIVAGIGNIYSAESLFRAGIRPQKSAGSISLKKYEDLAFSIKEVLMQAIESGGTTLKDFVGGDNKPGFFKQNLFVYGRSGKRCKKCLTLLKNLKITQRSSFYCPKCQR